VRLASSYLLPAASHLLPHPPQENARLEDQVKGLSDELHAMHSAWGERDVRQRVQDEELKDSNRQVGSQHRLLWELSTPSS